MARRFPKRDEVRHGGENYRRAGTYQTRPMRAETSTEVVIEHKGGPWYRVRKGTEVLEENARGKDEAESIKRQHTG